MVASSWLVNDTRILFFSRSWKRREDSDQNPEIFLNFERWKQGQDKIRTYPLDSIEMIVLCDMLFRAPAVPHNILFRDVLGPLYELEQGPQLLAFMV
jgi:hypothetical protein